MIGLQAYYSALAKGRTENKRSKIRSKRKRADLDPKTNVDDDQMAGRVREGNNRFISLRRLTLGTLQRRKIRAKKKESNKEKGEFQVTNEKTSEGGKKK